MNTGERLTVEEQRSMEPGGSVTALRLLCLAVALVIAAFVCVVAFDEDVYRRPVDLSVVLEVEGSARQIRVGTDSCIGSPELVVEESAGVITITATAIVGDAWTPRASCMDVSVVELATALASRRVVDGRHGGEVVVWNPGAQAPSNR